MDPRRIVIWIAAVALLAPAAAVAQPPCGPAAHCPMAAAATAPCHGASVQADDCCAPGGEVQAVEVAPLGPAVAAEGAAIELAPGLAPAAGRAGAADREGSATPLYTLFRALLI